MTAAAEQWGYTPEQIQLRVYVGKFGSAKTGHEAEIRARAKKPGRGLLPFEVIGVDQVARAARKIAESKTYRDNPALVAIKVLEAAGMLLPPLPDDETGS